MASTQQETELTKILEIFEGRVVSPTEKEAPQEEDDIFARHLTPAERKLLQQFTCLRFFSQIDTLICELGLTAEFFRRAQGALRELATFLPLNDLQIVLFVVLYMNSEDTGSDIDINTICEALHLPSQRLLSLIDWREMEDMGLLKTNFQCSPAVLRLPEQVIDAVAMVDMAFYLKLFKNRGAEGTVEDKTDLFMLISLGRIKKK